MKLSKVFVALAALGVLFGIRTVFQGNKQPVIVPPIYEPAKPPFEKFVAGAGIIEPNTENIEIATQINGVVAEVFVNVGQEIKKGDPLFLIDDRKINADLLAQMGQRDVALAELDDTRRQLTMWQKIADKRAVSSEDYVKKQYAVRINEAKVASAEFSVKALATQLDLHTVRSPIDGQVLQVKIKKGEIASSQNSTASLMVVGSLKPLNIRVDVDENDAWRVKHGAKGKAFLRGNTEVSFDLQFVKFEPYVIPKKSLTGESAERVDTRVLQVVYSIVGEPKDVFVGQLVDVYVESN